MPLRYFHLALSPVFLTAMNWQQLLYLKHKWLHMHTPVTTLLFPQNVVLGTSDQSRPFKLSFWICVRLSKHLPRSSESPSLLKIGCNSVINTLGSLCKYWYVLEPVALSLQKRHQELFPLG